MPFDYYKKLSASQRRTYRESDQIGEVDLGGYAPARPYVHALWAALDPAPDPAPEQPQLTLPF